MALFKMNRGNSNTLPTKLTDGYAYFCTDTAEFFIDYADLDGTLYRKKLNAKDAETLTGMSLDQIKEYNLTQFYTKTEVNDKVAEVKAYTDANSFKIKKVDTLPVAKDKSTIYVQNSEEFIWVEQGGTVVPNDGTFVESVYINTNLTPDEVNSIIASANLSFVDYNGMPAYFTLVAGTTGLGIYNLGDGYGLGSGDLTTGSMITFFGRDEEGGYKWFDFTNPVEFNAASINNLQGITIGGENSKLIDIFSITPFFTKRAVPNDGTFVGIIYFDTSKSIEETNAILSQLTYISSGDPYGNELYWIGANPSNSIPIQIGVEHWTEKPEWGYKIGASFIDKSGNYSSVYIFDSTDGWTQNFIEINTELKSHVDTTPDFVIGDQNNLLTEIIYIAEKVGDWEKLGPSLDGYATEEYVNNAIANIPGVDLSGYVKLSDLPALLDEYMQWGKFKDLV